MLFCFPQSLHSGFCHVYLSPPCSVSVTGLRIEWIWFSFVSLTVSNLNSVFSFALVVVVLSQCFFLFVAVTFSLHACPTNAGCLACLFLITVHNLQLFPVDLNPEGIGNFSFRYSLRRLNNEGKSLRSMVYIYIQKLFLCMFTTLIVLMCTSSDSHPLVLKWYSTVAESVIDLFLVN